MAEIVNDMFVTIDEILSISIAISDDSGFSGVGHVSVIYPIKPQLLACEVVFEFDNELNMIDEEPWIAAMIIVNQSFDSLDMVQTWVSDAVQGLRKSLVKFATITTALIEPL